MTVENISISMKTDADKAAKNLNSLAASLEKVSKAASATSGEKSVEAVGNAAKRAEKNTKPLASDLQKAIESATKYEVLVHKAAAAQVKMGEAFETGNESAAWAARERAINAATQAAKEYEKSQPKVEQTSPLFSKSASDATSNGHRLADALKRIANGFKQLVSHGKSASKSIKSVGNSAKHSSGMLGKLWSSIKRIAMYRLLRTALKDMTQSFQEGLKHAYAFSKAVGGDLARALDSVASAGGQMKNQMGAALGELLQTIQPIIEAIISMVTRLMQVLSALFAALGGRLTYSVAEKTAEAWGDAAGSAKEYKNTVLGFDELNKLNDESGGGGGGGGAEGAFKDVELPEWALKLKELFDRLKDLFKLGDFEGAGRELAKWLNDIWPDDKWWHDKGVWLGEQINKVIDFAFGFLDEINTRKMGGGIASFLNGVIETVKWERLGRVIALGIARALDFAIGFIEKLNTRAIAEAISNLIIGFFDEITKWLAEKDWKEIGQTIGTKIHDFITGIKWDEIATNISSFLIELFNSISDFLDGVDWEQLGKDVFKAIKDFVTHIDWEGIIESAWESIGKAVKSVGGFVTGILEEAGIISEIEGAVETITTILSDAALALGAILLFTGHIPLGIGLIVAGLAGKDEAQANWDIVPEEIKGKLAEIEAAAAVALLALGIILALSGAALPLGLGMIVAGGALLVTRVSEDWNLIPQQVQTTLATIGTVVGIALIALGIVLLLTGVGAGLGIGMILAGGSILASVVAFNFTDTTNEVNGCMESIGETGETQFGKIVKAINAIIDAVKSVIDWFGSMKNAVSEVNNRLNDIEGHKSTFGNAWGEMVRGAEIGAWASGGMPEVGSLFIAGEAGAELVTNMGNGRTGVTNVEQMEAAVANGNIGVINAVYQMANMIVKAVNEIDPDITLDGESLADKMYNYNQNAAKRRGVAMVT